MPAADMERSKLTLPCNLSPALVVQGRRALVSSQFIAMLCLVGIALDSVQVPWPRLTGVTPPAARGTVVAQFHAHAALA